MKWTKYNYAEYLKSERWGVIRKLVRHRDEGRCKFCNSTDSLHTHHRSYDHLNEDLPKEVEDCVLVCATCHGKLHDDTPPTQREAYHEGWKDCASHLARAVWIAETSTLATIERTAKEERWMRENLTEGKTREQLEKEQADAEG
jgi:hypothetical protein